MIKKIVIITLLTLYGIYSFGQCPMIGHAKDSLGRDLNVKKNRSVFPQKKSITLSLDSILKTGKDTKRFSDTSLVSITGYVFEIVGAGKESCNCDSTSYLSTDIHIYVGKKGVKSKSECFIVELSPQSKKKFPQMKGTKDWKVLLGKEVTFTGWLFFDWEHTGNAINSCKKCTRIWRRTCWEIHPVTNIQYK